MPIKIPMALFTKTEKNPKFVWCHKRSQITKVILRKNTGDITPSDFKRYYKPN